MKLTPLDIKRQEFTRTFRGIDADEVHSFLQMVADQWEKLMDENRRLDQQVRDLEGKLIHYRKIEEALQEALETARNNSNRTIENAQREAQIILKEAKSHADELRTQVRNERSKLKHDVSKILGRKDEIVARLRAFLMSEMEILARFEKHDQMGLLQIDSASMNSIGYSSDSYEVDPPAPPPRERRQETPPLRAPEPAPPPPPAQDPPAAHVSERSPRADFTPSHDAADIFEEHENNRPFSPDSSSNGRPLETGDLEFDTHIGNALSQAVAETEELEDSDGLSTDELEFIKSTVTSAAAFDEDNGSIFAQTEEEEMGAYNEPVNDAWASHEPVGQSADPFDDDKHTYPFNAPQHGDEREAYFDPDSTEQDDAIGGGWIVRPAVSNNASNKERQRGFDPIPGSILGDAVDDEEVSATPEEIEKIRRILNDLD